MSNPKFSVVIPAYNVDRYIAECLDSILGQGRNDVEVIVVNDGSTDSTSEVVGGFVHEQASVLLVNQENRGLLVNETSNHFGSRIRRAIVHDDDLNIISSLAQYGIKTFCDIPVNVISRNDN